jgi:hypothetical protein
MKKILIVLVLSLTSQAFAGIGYMFPEETWKQKVIAVRNFVKEHNCNEVTFSEGEEEFTDQEMVRSWDKYSSFSHYPRQDFSKILCDGSNIVSRIRENYDDSEVESEIPEIDEDNSPHSLGGIFRDAMIGLPYFETRDDKIEDPINPLTKNEITTFTKIPDLEGIFSALSSSKCGKAHVNYGYKFNEQTKEKTDYFSVQCEGYTYGFKDEYTRKIDLNADRFIFELSEEDKKAWSEPEFYIFHTHKYTDDFRLWTRKDTNASAKIYAFLTQNFQRSYIRVINSKEKGHPGQGYEYEDAPLTRNVEATFVRR